MPERNWFCRMHKGDRERGAGEGASVYFIEQQTIQYSKKPRPFEKRCDIRPGQLGDRPFERALSWRLGRLAMVAN